MLRSTVAVLLAVCLLAGAGVAGEKPWFDMSCAMCSNMVKHDGLMENVKWEQHNIKEGVVALTLVNEKYLDAYRSAHADMEKTGKKLMSGEEMKVCGSCNALSKCFKEGATKEYVGTSTGGLMIVTSTNPEVVAELHNWATKNKEEMKKMKAMKMGKKG